MIGNDFDRNKVIFDAELLFAFGYPSSKFDYNKHNNEYELTPFQYFGTEINESNLFKRSSSIVDDHLLIKFVKRKTKHPSKTEFCIAPNPFGISGGGLFRVFMKNDHPEVFVLDGILTEWHCNLSLMKCAKIQKVNKFILGNTFRNYN
jgi:hypothetical protein